MNHIGRTLAASGSGLVLLMLVLVGCLEIDPRTLPDAAVFATATAWIHRVFPDLSALNRSIEAVHGLPIPASEVAWSLLGGVAWCLGFLLVAVVVFERRDFR